MCDESHCSYVICMCGRAAVCASNVNVAGQFLDGLPNSAVWPLNNQAVKAYKLSCFEIIFKNGLSLESDLLTLA